MCPRFKDRSFKNDLFDIRFLNSSVIKVKRWLLKEVHLNRC